MSHTTDTSLTRFIGVKAATGTDYQGTIIGFVDDLNGNTHVVVHWTSGPDRSQKNFVDVTDLEDLFISLKEALS